MDRRPVPDVENDATSTSRNTTPKNFNFWYYFGSLRDARAGIQIVTGIFLTMNYKPSAEEAFASVEYIMRDVRWGWLDSLYALDRRLVLFHRRLPAHVSRDDVRLVQQAARAVWIIGMLIYLALMAEAFMGYLLPWGQMSYWGAQVIVSLFGAIPVIGERHRRSGFAATSSFLTSPEPLLRVARHRTCR